MKQTHILKCSRILRAPPTFTQAMIYFAWATEAPPRSIVPRHLSQKQVPFLPAAVTTKGVYRLCKMLLRLQEGLRLQPDLSQLAALSQLSIQDCFLSPGHLFFSSAFRTQLKTDEGPQSCVGGDLEQTCLAGPELL